MNTAPHESSSLCLFSKHMQQKRLKKVLDKLGTVDMKHRKRSSQGIFQAKNHRQIL